MEVDDAETGFALIRQGYCQNNLIFKLNQRNIIGRGFGTTINILSLFVSRQHCVMYMEDDGNWYIRDCETMNGTFINDEKIQPNIDYLLNLNDKIGFGISISSLNNSEYSNPDYYVYKLIYYPTQQDHIYEYDVNSLCWDLEKL
ncbi:unnamed protein product [Chironomus riparius]|uniref:FHA domain-containing protein n=1 Tax=Chironomus riparius TaxID=315576 RepID=A0A9N9RRI5_9DIPT|nr:unnamed protein product [Chironomus riparius]